MVSLSKRLMHIRDQDCDDAQPQLSKFEHFALTVCLRVPSAEAVTNGHAGKSQISDERRQGSEIFSDIPVIFAPRMLFVGKAECSGPRFLLWCFFH